jgi:hypothetical protein
MRVCSCLTRWTEQEVIGVVQEPSDTASPQPLLSSQRPWTVASASLTAIALLLTVSEVVAVFYEVPDLMFRTQPFLAAACAALAVAAAIIALFRESKSGGFAALVAALVPLVAWLIVGLVVVTVMEM